MHAPALASIVMRVAVEGRLICVLQQCVLSGGGDRLETPPPGVTVTATAGTDPTGPQTVMLRGVPAIGGSGETSIVIDMAFSGEA